VQLFSQEIVETLEIRGHIETS